MTFILHSSIKLDGRVVIVPVVSAANVGQLSMDLVISSLSLERIAVLDSRFCVPVVGARENGENGVTTPLERELHYLESGIWSAITTHEQVYGRPDIGFVVMQQRSPVLKSMKVEFIEALFEFIKTSKFSAVLFLSGIDLSNRTDAQMMTSTYQLRPRNTPNLDETPLKSLLSLAVPVYSSLVQQYPQSYEDEPPIPFIPGGGLMRKFLSSIPVGWDIPTAGLIQFVLEGDNRADAGLLASIVVNILGRDIAQWTQPSSWRDGLFGTPHDQTLYG